MVRAAFISLIWLVGCGDAGPTVESSRSALLWHAGVFRYLPSQSANLETFVGGLSHPTSGYGKVSTQRTTDFNTFVDAMLQAIDDSNADGSMGDWCGVITAAGDTSYDIHRFYDTGTGRWFIYANDNTSFGQAYIFINPHAKRDLVIEVPHEPFDMGTAIEGVRMFRDLAARALIINKEDRCADPDATTCSGTTTVCSGSSEAFRESDLPHEPHNTLHLIHKKLNDRSTGTKFLQLHQENGSSSDYAEISDGSTTNSNSSAISETFATELRTRVPTSSSVHGCQTESGLSNCGTTNIQGRYSNGTGPNECTTGTSTASARFLHIEQRSTLIDNDDGDGWSYGDVRDALINTGTWGDCNLNNGATDCTLGDSQTQYANCTCGQACN
jgi:hypothetical protein